MASMAQSVQSDSRPVSVMGRQARPRGSLWFDWLFTLMCCWFVGGVHLDGWAHNHIPDLETFFTPWHAVLYSGYVVSAAVLVLALVRNHGRGYAWRRALPPGYAVSLAGAAVFAVGGVLDMLWHLLFGIEVSVEALLSPTHLLLATGGILMITGPLRAAWQRLPGHASFTWRTGLPALLSLTLVLALLAFFTQFAHPFVDNWASINVQGTVTPFFDQALGNRQHLAADDTADGRGVAAGVALGAAVRDAHAPPRGRHRPDQRHARPAAMDRGRGRQWAAGRPAVSAPQALGGASHPLAGLCVRHAGHPHTASTSLG